MDYNSIDELYNSNCIVTHLVTVKFNGKRKWQFRANCFPDEGAGENPPVTFFKVKNDEKDYSTYVEWTSDEYITICIDDELIFADLIDSKIAGDNMNVNIVCESDGNFISVECKYLLDSATIDAEVEAQTNASVNDSSISNSAIGVDKDENIEAPMSDSSYSGLDIFLILLATPIVGLLTYLLTAILVGDDSDHFTLWFIIIFIITMIIFIAQWPNYKKEASMTVSGGCAKHGGAKVPKIRIKKYNPTDWRKPSKRGKQFY